MWRRLHTHLYARCIVGLQLRRHCLCGWVGGWWRVRSRALGKPTYIISYMSQYTHNRWHSAAITHMRTETCALAEGKEHFQLLAAWRQLVTCYNSACWVMYTRTLLYLDTVQRGLILWRHFMYSYLYTYQSIDIYIYTYIYIYLNHVCFVTPHSPHFHMMLI